MLNNFYEGDVLLNVPPPLQKHPVIKGETIKSILHQFFANIFLEMRKF